MNNSGNIIDLDLIPGNIKDGVDIFGVVGVFAGGSSSLVLSGTGGLHLATACYSVPTGFAKDFYYYEDSLIVILILKSTSIDMVGSRNLTLGLAIRKSDGVGERMFEFGSIGGATGGPGIGFGLDAVPSIYKNGNIYAFNGYSRSQGGGQVGAYLRDVSTQTQTWQASAYSLGSPISLTSAVSHSYAGITYANASYSVSAPGSAIVDVINLGATGTFVTGTGVSLGSLYPGQNIYAMLSPLHRISGNFDNVNAGFACLEVSGVKYYFMTMALGIDQSTRSTTCITSVGIDNGGVFTNIVVNWGGSVTFNSGTWGTAEFYLDGTDIHCSNRTNAFAQGRHVTFDTLTNTFTNSVSGSANTRHILGFSSFASVDTINSVEDSLVTPAGTIITNSFASGGFTYTSNVVGDSTVTNPGSSPVGRTIGGIHVATKV